jgi:protein KTI12
MLLLVLSGLPASGKTTLAKALAAEFAEHGLRVDVVSDGANLSKLYDSNMDCSSLRRPRQELYADSAAEKATRARLLAAAERALAPNTVVLVDSLNYIKGFRYELFCVAKTCAARYAVVQTMCSEEECVQQDGLRQDCYGAELVRALARRFEPPDRRNRWDSPLFTVDTGGAPVLNSVLASGACPNDNASSAVAAEKPNGCLKAVDSSGQWQQRVSEIVAECLSKSQPLRTTMATQPQLLGGADVFNALDRATREAEASIMSSIHAGVGDGDRIRVPGSSRPVVLTRTIKIAELRGMRRAHINLARLCPPQDTSKTALVDGYVDYVNAQLRPDA